MEISKSTTRNNLSYLLTAILPNKDGKLLSGMFGPDILPYRYRQLLHCQYSANSSLPPAFRGRLCMDRKTLGIRPFHAVVTLSGIQKDGKATITSGVQVGEMIAVSGLRFLSDGMVVEFSQDRRDSTYETSQIFS